MKKVSPITKPQVYEIVYDSMVELIENGSWKSGDRIPGEIELADQFQVSRNSLRTAIKVLASHNILICKPGIGTFVAERALSEIGGRKLISMMQDDSYEQEILHVREIIDISTAKESAEKCSEEDIAEMEKCIEKRLDALRRNDMEDAIYWGSHFHEVIVSAVGNRFLTEIYKSLRKELYRDRVSYIRHIGLTESVEKYVSEDRKLLEAFRSHDGNLAHELMIHHMEIRLHDKDQR